MKRFGCGIAAALLSLFIASGLSQPIFSQQSTLSGQLHIVWSDKQESSRSGGSIRYMLVDDQGNGIEIQLNELLARPMGGILALNKRRVRLSGHWSGAQLRSGFVAESVQLDQLNQNTGLPDANVSAVTGSLKWVNILCRFSDSPGVTPNALSYFSGLMGALFPGLNHYWREISYNNINLTGTMTVGWYNLPNTRAFYIYDMNGDGTAEADLQRLVDAATAAADADVYFPDFSGINLMFNQNLDGYALGGSWTLYLDRKYQTFSLTWLPPWGYQNQSVLAHEMGHGFGLTHSSGPYNDVYDSPWDVMSDNWASSLNDPIYKNIGIHTISYHKDFLGWIPSARKLTLNAGMRRTITLERLAQPVSASNYLMVQIPIAGSSNQFYTVETRQFAGYDNGLPGEAVIIHSVDTTRASRTAQVVDADGNGNPGDAGSMWLPGEKFTDAAHNISVAVRIINATSMTVTVNSGAVEFPALNDFDGDGSADPAVLRPGTGVWYILKSGTPGQFKSTQWGVSSDKAVAADYDGDGKTDIAVWRPETGIWYILPSQSPGTYIDTHWGVSTDRAVPGDYDGDGIADIAVWRPENGGWYILPSNSAGSLTITEWGASGDIPVPGDYDGDGKTDIAVWRPGSGTWYVLRSGSPGNYTATQWGVAGDKPVPADYDGDGKQDIAVWRPNTGTWFLLPSSTPGNYTNTQWGVPADVPAPGRYDADRKADIAVWRPSDGVWYVLPSRSPGTYTATKWGAGTDVPISSATGIAE